MSDLRPDPQMDERLADFTDRLMQDQEVKVQISTDDTELAELEQTVQRLKTAAQAAQPDDATAGRIRARVLKEWKQSTSPLKWWTWSRMAVAGAAILLIFTAALSLVQQSENQSLTGASGLDGSGQYSLLWIPGIGLLGIILVILLRSKRK